MLQQAVLGRHVLGEQPADIPDRHLERSCDCGGGRTLSPDQTMEGLRARGEEGEPFLWGRG